MSVEQKILESKEDLANLEVGDIVPTTLGEMVLYEQHKPKTSKMSFVREMSPTEIEFYSSIRDSFDVADNQVVFPRYLKEPSYTLREGGAFSGWFDMARDLLNKVYSE